MTSNNSGSRLNFMFAQEPRAEELQELVILSVARLLNEAKPAGKEETEHLFLTLIAYSITLAQNKCAKDLVYGSLTGMMFLLRGQRISDGPTALQ